MEHEFAYKKERIQEIMLKTPENSSDEQKSENGEEDVVGSDPLMTDEELK